MGIERLSEVKIVEFRYKSADDDVWDITYYDSKDRRYLKLKKSTDETEHIWDVQMLMDLASHLGILTNPQPAPQTDLNGNLIRAISQFKAPVITDHRVNVQELDEGIPLTAALANADIEEDIQNRRSLSRTSTGIPKVRRLDPGGMM